MDLAGLRAWLEAGVADRWRELEAVIQRARAADFALAMWWEHEWRLALRKTQRANGVSGSEKLSATPRAQAPRPGKPRRRQRWLPDLQRRARPPQAP